MSLVVLPRSGIERSHAAQLPKQRAADQTQALRGQRLPHRLDQRTLRTFTIPLDPLRDRGRLAARAFETRGRALEPLGESLRQSSERRGIPTAWRHPPIEQVAPEGE